MDVANVKLQLPRDFSATSGSLVWIDGRKIDGVKTVGFKHVAGEIRLLTLEIYANIDIEVYDPVNLEEVISARTE